MKYEDITFEMLGTRRQRPMYLSKFTKFRQNLDMNTYPKDPHAYTETFLQNIDEWINSHIHVRYNGLETFTRRDAILGTTHQLDELHQLHGHNVVVFKGEYKYHRRLTDFTVNQITNYKQLFTVFMLLLIVGCEGKEGPVGPQGPQGPQGRGDGRPRRPDPDALRRLHPVISPCTPGANAPGRLL